MKIALVNGRIITPYRVLDRGAVLIEDGKIVAVGNDFNVPSEYSVFDCCKLYVSPGFVDIHVHGGGGHDFMDGTKQAILGAAKAHMKHGTTSLSPTTLACPDEELFTFFDLYKDVKRNMKDGPNLIGIHMEGPYFSYNQRGAQDPKYLRNPDKKHYKRILDYCSDIVRMTVAPELEGALDLGYELSKRGIVAAIGHSDACYQELVPAFECGYKHVTHLYSGMSTIHRRNAFRKLGVVETAYLIDEMTVEIIADGCHLPVELLKLIVKTKNNDKISLITDSSRGSGLPEGSKIILGSLSHGQECLLEGGVAIMPDRTSFAGSVSTSDRCVRTMYKQVGLPIEEAVAMMTINPSKVLGIQKRKGVLAAGFDADINMFDDDVIIKHVMIGGELRF